MSKKLSLNKESIQVLVSDDLDGVFGGASVSSAAPGHKVSSALPDHKVSSAFKPTATAVSSAHKPVAQPTSTAVSSAHPSPIKPTSSAIFHW
jgi:hypothetical protein